MQDMITVTLTKAEALAVADRIRTLYHRPAQNTIDLADAAEPMAWLLEQLAVALGQYGPGVRREARP